MDCDGASNLHETGGTRCRQDVGERVKTWNVGRRKSRWQRTCPGWVVRLTGDVPADCVLGHFGGVVLVPMESGLRSMRDGKPRASLLSLRVYFSALFFALCPSFRKGRDLTRLIVRGVC